MIIRHAKTSDKSDILKFCKNTFSWGDYVGDVWDSWMNEGNLFVLEDSHPIGICHASFANKQVWIEGIRIHPNFRRRGAASMLVQEIEFLAKQKGKEFSYMLTDVTNFISIAMAEKLGYSIYQTWGFYSLDPKPNSNYSITFGHNLEIPHYVKSWRWLPLDSSSKSKMKNENRIVFSTNDTNQSAAILTDSEHFEKSLIVTFISSNPPTDENLLKYLENFGFENNYKRIQVICKEDLEHLPYVQKRNVFHLMKKSLN